MDIKDFKGDKRLLKATLEAYAPYDVYVDYIIDNKEWNKEEYSTEVFAKKVMDGMKAITPNDYQKMAAQFINEGLTATEQTLHGVLGLTSEAGEVSGLFQKFYQGHVIKHEHLKKELGDCLWMIAEICTSTGWDMSEIMAMNISKLKARYPNGFSTEKSLHRKDGDI